MRDGSNPEHSPTASLGARDGTQGPSALPTFSTSLPLWCDEAVSVSEIHAPDGSPTAGQRRRWSRLPAPARCQEVSVTVTGLMGKGLELDLPITASLGW